MTLVFETPYERRGVITPGLPVLAPGVERYPVSGGGSCSVQIEKDDEICVLDREGAAIGGVGVFRPRWYIRRRHAGGEKLRCAD